mmetsp:Transcript_27285/g.34845  ORF Transcript_27285/g.34845 Transcript_27285/m.34845 type:complete len:519 (+) Transcript_27285:52-1608(+)
MFKFPKLLGNRSPNRKMNKSNATSIRLLQWNILADGLGEDGFLATEFSPIFESADTNSKGYAANDFMKLVREAKLADTASGMTTKFSKLKGEEKKLKKMKASAEGYEELKESVAKLKEETEKSELVKLKKQFQNSPQLEKVDSEILHWSKRYDRLKRIALEADPDVITFQEIDHVKQFLEDRDFSAKYTCMVDSSKTYKPPNYTENKGNDDLSPDKYFQHILNSRAAFAPKSYSNAYLFRSKRDGKASDIDDDGCAIFWKKEILKPVELGFLRVPSDTEKSEAVLALTLQHLKTDMTFNVITTHLPSGDEPKKELERLAVLNNPSANWTARRIHFQGKDWKEVPYEDNPKFVGIASYVKHFVDRKQTDSSRTIFALDANSRPSFPRIKSDSSSDETNVWHTILSQTTLESIWVQNACIKENGESSDPKNPFVVSVNKMRGPSSNQPPKIGEHQLELIDHVFTNGKKSELVTHVDFNKKDFVPTAPKRYISKEGDAEIDLFPSSTMPSDHLPVVVNITM